MNDRQFYCNLTALFWKYYLLEPTKEHFEEMVSYFSEQLVLIGTGKHEFYTDLDKILVAMGENQAEAVSVSFDVLDEWYECLEISPEIFLVYGGIWVRQQGHSDSEVLIEMDTRFSMIFRQSGDKTQLVHIHHSIPYADQQQGEYYPKTLSEKAKAAMNLAELFRRQSELDLMTEIYNNVSFKHHITENMKTYNRGNLYLFDLDYFKSINDTYGHATGDSLLKLFADTLKQTFCTDAIIGRVGGDEFAVFECLPQPKELTSEKLAQMQEQFCRDTYSILGDNANGFSVGIVSMTDTLYFYDSVFANADRALYHAKKLGRGTYFWHCE